MRKSMFGVATLVAIGCSGFAALGQSPNSNFENPVPECASPDGWAAMVAFGKLKAAGLISPTSTDFDRTSVTLLASQTKAKGVYRQVFLIDFVKKLGRRSK